MNYLRPQCEKPDHFVCATLFQIETEKSHMKLPGNLVTITVVQHGTIGERIVKGHFPTSRMSLPGVAIIYVNKALPVFVL